MNFFKLSLLVISLFAFSSCAQLSSSKSCCSVNKQSCCSEKGSCTIKGKCKADKSCCKDACKSCDGVDSCATGACDLKK
jgi:hypothetical protein